MKSIKCPNCGFVGFASINCKRCQKPINIENNQLTDEKTLASIKSKQSLIFGIGGIISLILSFSTVFIIEDAVTMAFSFVGIIAIGLIISWLIGSLVERKLLSGNKLNYKITSAEKATVFGASLFFSYFVLINVKFGYLFAPLMVIFFNGMLYLYEYQMNKRIAVR